MTRWSYLRLAWIGLVVMEPAAAQSREDTYYEEFDPSAPPLTFREPAPTSVEYYSSRTMRVERRAIDPALLEPANGLEFYLFRVGQADAMLVVGPAPLRKTMLVDLGVSREEGFTGRFSAQHVGQRILDITGKRRLDYFVLSHFHSDHFGGGDSGITALIAHGGFTIGTVIDTGPLGSEYVSRSQGALEYITRQVEWQRSGKIGNVERPRFGTGQISLGSGVEVDMVAFAGRYAESEDSVHAQYQRRHPRHFSDFPTSENDLSIAMRISLGDFEFWTAGDLSGASGAGTDSLSGSNRNYTNVEWPMVRYWRTTSAERDVEVYRANHHGSGYSSTRQLLAALDPEIILYSARGGHGHPTPAMITRGSETAIHFATGIDPDAWTEAGFGEEGGQVAGEIRLFVTPDGDEYSINGQTFPSFSDAEERAGADSAR